ncbi:hypothetical protein D3C76_1766270 [compost metagenome]
MGDQVIALEDKAHAIIAVGVPIAVLEGLGGGAVNDQVAAVVLIQAADQVEAGGFAGAAGSQNRDKFILAEA